MSHFTVVVVGKDVEALLQPYHEYECTGIEDEHVVWVDEHDEVVAKYNEEGAATAVRLNDGTLVSPSAGMFYRPATPEEAQKIGSTYGSGWSGDLHYITRYNDDDDSRTTLVRDLGGAEEIKVRYNQLYPNQLELFAYEYYGYKPHPETKRFGHKTNPNAKWDWWTIGGRWPGFFTNVRGEKVDQCRVSHLDMVAMKRAARDAAVKEYDEYEAATRGITPPELDWSQFVEKVKAGEMTIDAARSVWNTHPWVSAVSTLGYWSADKARFCVDAENPREAFCQRAEDRAGVPYAVLCNGQWVSKGEMGWFGMSNDTVDVDTWNKRVQDLYASLDPSETLTLVDCHI